jgi:hypothetical protein
MHARASGQERQVQLKTSFQFVSQASRCGPRLAGFLLQASAPSRQPEAFADLSSADCRGSNAISSQPLIGHPTEATAKIVRLR